jgi:hypothetical protein
MLSVVAPLSKQPIAFFDVFLQFFSEILHLLLN